MKSGAVMGFAVSDSATEVAGTVGGSEIAVSDSTAEVADIDVSVSSGLTILNILLGVKPNLVFLALLLEDSTFWILGAVAPIPSSSITKGKPKPNVCCPLVFWRFLDSK